MAANQCRGFMEILPCDWLTPRVGQGWRRGRLVDILVSFYFLANYIFVSISDCTSNLLSWSGKSVGRCLLRAPPPTSTGPCRGCHQSEWAGSKTACLRIWSHSQPVWSRFHLSFFYSKASKDKELTKYSSHRETASSQTALPLPNCMVSLGLNSDAVWQWLMY